jgi:flagellar biogenesis protein FliO
MTISKRLGAACLVLIASPAAAQTIGQAGGGPEISIWRVLGALLFCLLLAAGAAFALRTRLKGTLPTLKTGSPRRMRLIESLRLSHQTDLCIVEVDGEEIIVAASPHGPRFLPRGRKIV